MDLPRLLHYRVDWFHVRRVHARQRDGVLDFGRLVDPVGFGGGRFGADEVSWQPKLHHFAAACSPARNTRRLPEIDAVEFAFHIRDLVFALGIIAAVFHC